MGTIDLHQPAQGDVDGLVEVVGDVDEVWIERANHAGIHHRAVEPVEQALPVLAAHQYERHALDLVRLHQREHLEHLVERAETAGEHDGTRAVLNEHGLTHKEVAEVHTQVHVFVEPLLVRKLDTQADRLAVGTRRPPCWPPP